MSDFLTQPEWADRCGVSRRTFYAWRAAGLIPAPDVNLPGQLRWSIGLVERTMRGFRRPVTGRPAFGSKSSRRRQRGFQSQASRFEQSPRSLHRTGVSGQVISERHAPEVSENGSASPRNSIEQVTR